MVEPTEQNVGDEDTEGEEDTDVVLHGSGCSVDIKVDKNCFLLLSPFGNCPGIEPNVCEVPSLVYRFCGWGFDPAALECFSEFLDGGQ